MLVADAGLILAYVAYVQNADYSRRIAVEVAAVRHTEEVIRGNLGDWLMNRMSHLNTNTCSKHLTISCPEYRIASERLSDVSTDNVHYAYMEHKTSGIWSSVKVALLEMMPMVGLVHSQTISLYSRSFLALFTGNQDGDAHLCVAVS